MTVFVSGLVLLAVASSSARGEQDDPSDKKALLDRLLAAYLKYELPLPPKDAPMAKYQVAWTTNEKGKEGSLIALGFLTREAGPKSHAEMLIGTSQHLAWDKAQPSKVKPEIGVQKGIVIAGRGQFQTNSCLATALQCHERGWTELAMALYDLSMKEPFEHHIEREDHDRRGTPITEVAFLAWAHRANELFYPDTDRSVILRRLKVLITAEPRLNVGYNRDLVASLEAALVPGTGTPGSIESLIDDLVELCPADLHGDPPPRALALIERGFDAILGLLAHLGDKRLTRFYPSGFGSHIPTYPFGVGGICAMLLGDLAGHETAKTWGEDQADDGVWKARAQAWFEMAGANGEEPYLLENALPPGKWPNAYVLRVLSKKHPDQLDRLYREILEKRTDMESWPVADQVARSGLPRERKVELLKVGARHKNLDHRYAALLSLQKFDAEAGVAPLVECLEELPPTCPGKYSDSRESYFALLVGWTADPRPWKALAAAARRADAGLRLELVSKVSWEGTDGELRKQQVTFLAEFLTDESLRDVKNEPAKFDDRCAAHRFPRIEVRNVAAMYLASILGLEDDPEPSWTVDQWSEFRERVKKSIPQ